MLSKNKQKYVRSLHQKKFRDNYAVFVAEGPKIVQDLYGFFPCQLLLATEQFLAAHPHLHADEIIEVSQKELEQVSALTTPRDVLAVFGKERLEPSTAPVDSPTLQPLVLALDGVQDPGNLGTIIRLADWYGVRDIYCSRACADVYASKVVQATMGALARVAVHYVDLVDYLSSQLGKQPIYGTFLDGDDLYQMDLTPGGILVMGNEGNGISNEVRELVNRKLYIPNYPQGQDTSESLNVAIATAITCAEIRRQGITR